MPFKIVITETRVVRKILPKRWEKIGTKEVAREDQFISEDSEAKTRISDDMGYAPETETMTTETVEVLSQQVDALDLVAVIKAVNKIS